MGSPTTRDASTGDSTVPNTWETELLSMTERIRSNKSLQNERRNCTYS